jgi:hypothetical protein
VWTVTTDDLQAHTSLVLSELSGPQLTALNKFAERDLGDMMDPLLTHEQLMLIVEGKRRAEAPADVSPLDTFLDVFGKIVAVASGIASIVNPVAGSISAIAGAVTAVKAVK